MAAEFDENGKPSKPRPIGQMAYETQQIVERLKKAASANDETIITYAELTRLTGHNVRDESYGHLMAARRIAERETGRLFGCVPKQGIKLLAPTEQVATGVDAVTRMRRMTKRAITRAGHVQVEKLTDKERATYHTTSSVLGAVHLFTQAKSVGKIGDAVSKSADKLPIGDTLKLFGG